MNPAAEDDSGFDPVYLNTLRETAVLIVVFLLFLAWSIGTCFVMGYGQVPGTQPETVWGMPSWVFWGVLVPWMAANLFTFWFSMCYMADDPLGEAGSSAEDDQQPSAESEP